jgi:predicted ribonuclease YlaK
MTRNTAKQKPRVAAEQGYRKIRIDDLLTFEPITENQSKAKKAYNKDRNLMLKGYPGTGKTFLALLFALQEVLDPSSDYKRVAIIRSVVPTRDIGFLKGDDKEKIAVYETPYRDICEELFNIKGAYDILKAQGSIIFDTTSFIRGRSLHNTIFIVDECENLNFHELDSVITRVGNYSKIIYCGDHGQTDFTKEGDKIGLINFSRILKEMDNFTFVDFGIDDIVRSALVKSYIIAKDRLGF